MLGVKSEIKCFNQKWLRHHQLEFYSKEDMLYNSCTYNVIIQGVVKMI
jgi:hypothetical protein